jgi:hypothetical protein
VAAGSLEEGVSPTTSTQPPRTEGSRPTSVLALPHPPSMRIHDFSIAELDTHVDHVMQDAYHGA